MTHQKLLCDDAHIKEDVLKLAQKLHDEHAVLDSFLLALSVLKPQRKVFLQALRAGDKVALKTLIHEHLDTMKPNKNKKLMLVKLLDFCESPSSFLRYMLDNGDLALSILIAFATKTKNSAKLQTSIERDCRGSVEWKDEGGVAAADVVLAEIKMTDISKGKKQLDVQKAVFQVISNFIHPTVGLNFREVIFVPYYSKVEAGFHNGVFVEKV
eukprot:Colp12_sorted_trinity150504_noHs@33062